MPETATTNGKHSATEPKTKRSKQRLLRMSAQDRRAFILRQLRSNGMLSLDLINRTFSSPFRTVLDDDIKALKELGFEPEWTEITGNRYLVDASARHIGTKFQREMLRWREKESCGMVAASLTLGLPPFDRDVANYIEGAENKAHTAAEEKRRATLRDRFCPHFKECWSQRDIIHNLVGKTKQGNVQGAAQNKALRVAMILRQIWMESTIRIFLDSGTTTDRVARYLRDVCLPSPYSLLTGMTVCTNSRGIFDTLGSFEVPIRTEVIGGYQLDNSETLVGPIAEASISNETLAPFSMSILGTTMADMRRQVLCTDTPEERGVKHAAFSNAQLRICVIDDSKFKDAPIRESYCFTKLIPEQIDLVITNEPLNEGGQIKTGPARKTFDDSIRKIRDNGVPVLVGYLDPDTLLKQYARGTEIRTRLGLRLIERLQQDIRYVRHRQTETIERLFNRVLADYYTLKTEDPTSPELRWFSNIVQKVSEEVEEMGNQESPYARAKRERHT